MDRYEVINTKITNMIFYVKNSNKHKNPNGNEIVQLAVINRKSKPSRTRTDIKTYRKVETSSYIINLNPREIPFAELNDSHEEHQNSEFSFGVSDLINLRSIGACDNQEYDVTTYNLKEVSRIILPTSAIGVVF